MNHGIRHLFTSVRIAKACATLALGFATTLCSDAFAQEPIKIGLILGKQGSIAEQAQNLYQGTMMALDQAGGKLLGRPVEVIWLDEPNPEAAQQNMLKLINEQKVVAVLGGGTSSNALALSAVALRTKTPYIANNAAASDLTGKACNRYTFRVQLPVVPQVRALAPDTMAFGKKWYFVTASFAFGQDILNESQRVLKAAGGTIAGSDQVPLNTPDFTSYILKIRQAKPDVVNAGLSGVDVSTFLKQWHQMGMTKQIKFAEVSVADSDIWALTPDAATGIYTKIWYYDNPKNANEDKDFARAYEAKFKRPAADRAWQGWFAMRSLLKSIEQAKSTEPGAIVTALEKYRDDDRPLPAYFRDFDHQMMLPIVVARVKDKVVPPYGFLDVQNVVPSSAAGFEGIYGTKAEVGCNLGPL